MDAANVPERLRRHEDELDRQPPLELTRAYVSGYVAHVDTLADLRTDLGEIAAYSVRALRRHLVALERLLNDPPPPGTLAHLVAWDANWVLDDPSDTGAEAFLRQLAAMLAEVIDEAEAARRSAGGKGSSSS